MTDDFKGFFLDQSKEAPNIDMKDRSSFESALKEKKNKNDWKKTLSSRL